MSAACPFTRACPLFVRAQSLAGRTGPAFEWTGAGTWLRLPNLFRDQKRGRVSARSLGSLMQGPRP